MKCPAIEALTAPNLAAFCITLMLPSTCMFKLSSVCGNAGTTIEQSSACSLVVRLSIIRLKPSQMMLSYSHYVLAIRYKSPAIQKTHRYKRPRGLYGLFEYGRIS